MFARLGQHLDGDILGNVIAFDEAAHEIEIGLRGGGEGHLDFLEADVAQRAEHAQLALGIHRFEQRLVAVTQIGAHPDRWLRQRPIRPLPIGERDRGKRAVLATGVFQHGGDSLVAG